jgi:hypothetical protein
MIRAFGLPGVGLEFVNEPLAIWYIEESRATIGATNGWEFLLEWADSVRPRISPEAYASFLLTHISGSASDEGAWNAFIPLLLSAVRKGRPRVIHLALYFGMWTVPRKFRRFIRRQFKGRPKSKSETK